MTIMVSMTTDGEISTALDAFEMKTRELAVGRGLEAAYPVLGLFAVVARPFVLRRRRIVRLESMANAER